MKDELISCAAFFTTTEADDPGLSVLLPLLAWPFTALLLEAEGVCLELSFDALLTIFDDPFTSFDVELATVEGAVSNFSLFSAGGELVALSVASGDCELSLFVFDREEDEDDWSEPEAAGAFSLDSGGDSVLRFLCI